MKRKKSTKVNRQDKCLQKRDKMKKNRVWHNKITHGMLTVTLPSQTSKHDKSIQKLDIINIFVPKHKFQNQQVRKTTTKK